MYVQQLRTKKEVACLSAEIGHTPCRCATLKEAALCASLPPSLSYFQAATLPLSRCTSPPLNSNFLTLSLSRSLFEIKPPLSLAI